MRRRQSRRAEILAAVMSGESAERDRRIRRAIRRRSDLRDRPVHQFGKDGKADDAADLALIGRHAERGVALEMLDRTKALLLGKRDIVDGDVVLEIDKGLAGSLDPPHRRDRDRLVLGAWRRGRLGSKAAIGRGRAPASAPVLRQALRLMAPFAAPATIMPGGAAFGTKAAMSSRHCGLPPRWQVRCSDGFQPP